MAKKAHRIAFGPTPPSSAPAFKHPYQPCKKCNRRTRRWLGRCVFCESGFVPSEESVLAREQELRIVLSSQANGHLDKLLATGLFGRTREEVVERFVYDRLRDYIDMPRLAAGLKRKNAHKKDS